MTILDLQVLIRELIQRYDSTIDVTDGSKADKEIVQPILRRLGPDPYSTDVRAYLLDLLNQEFPDEATSDGDAITDFLVKPLELLLDPVVRENQRVRQQLSLRDTGILSIDEAEALGANFFEARRTGQSARGLARLYYDRPQADSINPSNFMQSRAGLSFFPDVIQSISAEEMVFNTESGLYYFDVSVTAEQAGDQYNIEPNELSTIANKPAVVRVTNKSKFKDGTTAEDAVTYLDRVEKSLSERSLVSRRGIIGRLMNVFPDMTRINIVGHGDPEMQRDVIEGQSFGRAIAGGLQASSVPDGDGLLKTRRLVVADAVDFTALIGPVGSLVGGVYLTLQSSSFGTPPIEDFEVLTVRGPQELDLVDRGLNYGLSNLPWQLRRKEILLGKIPGGILVPNTPFGELSVAPGQAHIGGCTDIHTRGGGTEATSIVIDRIVDESPLASGINAECTGAGEFILHDLVLHPFPLQTYTSEDVLYDELLHAYERNYAIQILDGPAPGTYLILSVEQGTGLNGYPKVTFDDSGPVPLPVFTGANWRIVDDLDVPLIDPGETLYKAGTLNTLQGSKDVSTSDLINFGDYGVTAGDFLSILSGEDIGVFAITALGPLPATFVATLDRAPQFTRSNVQFRVYRPNKAGTPALPLVRISSVDLLDANGLSTGVKVPYAKPLAAFSTSFTNPARGVKFEAIDCLLGVVSDQVPTLGLNLSGKTLTINVSTVPVPGFISVTFVGVDPIVLTDIVDQINAVVNVAVIIDGNRVGIRPVAPFLMQVVHDPAPASASQLLFGAKSNIRSDMVRAPVFSGAFFTNSIIPPLDVSYDVVQVVDGVQPGPYEISAVYPYAGVFTPPNQPDHIRTTTNLFPEVSRRVVLGARSLGKARVFFLDPTTIEFGPKTRFSADTENGELLYKPDPNFSTQIVPGLPNGTKIHDGVHSTPTIFVSALAGFKSKGVRVGDRLVLDYKLISGIAPALADPIVNLALTTFILEFDRGKKTLIFQSDISGNPTDVSLQGMVSQINNVLGANVARVSAINLLEIDPEYFLRISKDGTANTLLGFSNVVDTTNVSANAGNYRIVAINSDAQIVVSPAMPPAGAGEVKIQFRIERPGFQRIGTSQMVANKNEVDLYYFDVELVSLGTGDQYNIDADQSMAVDVYQSEGWFLSTEDENLSFSPLEKPHIHFTRTMHEDGTDDTQDTATTMYGQSVSVNYDTSNMVLNQDSFVRSETERVVCSSPLARHLIPHYVRLAITYSGGPTEDNLRDALETLIHSTFPEDPLQVSEVIGEITSRGSRSASNPITLWAVVHQRDRSIGLTRSQDQILVDRLAAFFPDVLNITRNS